MRKLFPRWTRRRLGARLDPLVLCSAFMRAYKFLDQKFGLKSLSERRLKISTLHDLNDPFELLPYEMSSERFILRSLRHSLRHRAR